MTHRYYVPDLHGQTSVTLPKEEAHHALHVLRGTVGSELVLFDGQNRQASARIDSISKKDVRCLIENIQVVDRESPRPMVVGVALPKGDRARSVVEKAVELGAATLVPVMCQRSIAKPKDNVVNRLRRYVIDSSKQCGRNQLMHIAPPLSWTSYLDTCILDHLPHIETEQNETIRCVAHPGGRGVADHILSPSPILFAVGPEGGLTETEIEQAVDAGWACVGLGPRILRVETAVSVLLAVTTECDEKASKRDDGE